MAAARISPFCFNSDATQWDYLDLPDDELGWAELIAITAAEEIDSLKNPNVKRYCGTVAKWAIAFARFLPAIEQFFRENGPAKWKIDIRICRVGMRQQFLGLRNIPEQFHVKSVHFTNPSDRQWPYRRGTRHGALLPRFE